MYTNNCTGRRPQTEWAVEVNVPDTSNSNYGTATNKRLDIIASAAGPSM